MGDGSKGEKIAGSKGDNLERVGSEDVGPDGYWFCRYCDPEVLVGVMDDQDVFVLSGSNLPGFAEELDGAGGTDAAGDVQGKMQIEEFLVRDGSQFGNVSRRALGPRLDRESSRWCCVCELDCSERFPRPTVGWLGDDPGLSRKQRG